MEFYIEYEGKLPSRNAKDRKKRRVEAHRIRRNFHSQLRRLWEKRISPFAGLPSAPDDPPLAQRNREYLDANSHPVKGTQFRCLPIVNKSKHLVCGLDITLYRREKPGSFVGPSGDLDNRIKVLFDAMTMPNESQLAGLSLEQDENPLFCLLEDDVLIIDVRINTVEIWTPYDSPQELREIKLSVKVKMMSTRFAGWDVSALPDI